MNIFSLHFLQKLKEIVEFDSTNRHKNLFVKNLISSDKFVLELTKTYILSKLFHTNRSVGGSSKGCILFHLSSKHWSKKSAILFNAALNFALRAFFLASFSLAASISSFWSSHSASWLQSSKLSFWKQRQAVRKQPWPAS